MTQVTHTTPYICFTKHARERFIERFAATVDDEDARKILVAMSREAEPWGMQPNHGSEYRIAKFAKTGDLVVMAMKPGIKPNNRVITTVMSEDYARQTIAHDRKKRKKHKAQAQRSRR